MQKLSKLKNVLRSIYVHHLNKRGTKKMTIKIQAYQKHGIKCDELVNEFEFCCWKKLKEWLEGFSNVHACKDCSAKAKSTKGCGKVIELHPKVKAKCGEYIMSWDREVYCDNCESSKVKEANK